MDANEPLKSIREGFFSLGYQLFRPPLPADRRDVWLRRLNTPSNFATIVFLEYKPSFKAYSIAFGVGDDDIMRRLRLLLSWPTVRDLLSSWRCARSLALPCWNLFDAGRALAWRYLSIPDADVPDSWRDEFEKLKDGLLDGVVHRVTDDLSFAQLLLRDDKPFEWRMSDPVLRAGEVVLALVRKGYSVAAITEELERVRMPIAAALGGHDPHQLISAIASTAHG